MQAKHIQVGKLAFLILLFINHCLSYSHCCIRRHAFYQTYKMQSSFAFSRLCGACFLLADFKSSSSAAVSPCKTLRERRDALTLCLHKYTHIHIYSVLQPQAQTSVYKGMLMINYTRPDPFVLPSLRFPILVLPPNTLTPSLSLLLLPSKKPNHNYFFPQWLCYICTNIWYFQYCFLGNISFIQYDLLVLYGSLDNTD